MSTYPSEKSCNKCGECKPIDQFYLHKMGKYGRKGTCSSCDRARMSEYRGKKGDALKHKARGQYLLRTYGITYDEYVVLLEQQDYSCAVCGTNYSSVLHGKLCVDHDHTTGRVRGLLCHPCNAALGLFKDSSEYLLRAVSYLGEQL